MKQFICFILTFAITIIAVAQERNYYAEAEQAFQRSEYKKAAKLYILAYGMTGRDTSAKQKISDECAELQKNARDQKDAGNIEGAIVLFKKLLEKNPNDAEARAFVKNKQSNQKARWSDFVEEAAGLNMKMVWVEGDSFLMGATSEQGADAYNDEQVIRRVRLDSYYISECEVTQAQWEKVKGTSIYQQASKAGGSANRGVGPDYPMYYVSWEEAQAFCKELSRMTGRDYRLPTEAQWEYAARGGKKADGTKFSGSEAIDAVAWYDSNSGGSTQPVMSKDPNGLGLYDMSGNVWEWCSDRFKYTYNVNDTNNPKGPSAGSCRVVRGGSWGSFARDCRVSYRYDSSPGRRLNDCGFRVVLLP